MTSSSLKFIFSRCPVSLMPPCLLLNLLAICPALPAPGFILMLPFAPSHLAFPVFGVLLIPCLYLKCDVFISRPTSLIQPRVVLPTDSGCLFLDISWQRISSCPSDPRIYFSNPISDLMNSVSVWGWSNLGSQCSFWPLHSFFTSWVSLSPLLVQSPQIALGFALSLSIVRPCETSAPYTD